ncbi:MAG TPA: nitrilase-related carbon-nitrogen hydrolase [Candidatus Kapabacteria bacterium]|nr:nitrilase-related carbon-nitrogen hydrolase [Candidatus Kapabacteria bacterium]
MLIKPAKLALAQTDCVLGDVRRNVEIHVENIERAIAAKADAILFPELSLTGYTLRDLNFEVALDPAASTLLDPLRKLSKKITIVCGGVEEDHNAAVYNAAFVFEDGDLLHVHRKLYPPTYGIFEEFRYFGKGDDLIAFNSKRLGRVGVLVCEDLWHPVLPYVLAQQGAQLIMTIAASPTRLDTGDDALATSEPQNYTTNREHHSTYARLLGVYLAFVNRIGVEDGVNFWGGSEVVQPSGEPCVVAKFFDPDLCFADLDPLQVRQARQLSRHFLDEDRLLTQKLISRLSGPTSGASPRGENGA